MSDVAAIRSELAIRKMKDARYAEHFRFTTLVQSIWIAMSAQ